MTRRALPAWLWGLVVGLLLAHNAYLWIGLRLAPDTDILALLPVERRDPALEQAFNRIIDAARQRLIVLVGADDWGQAVRAADAYGAVLAGRAGLLRADRVGEKTESDWLEAFRPHRAILLAPREEEALRRQGKEYWVGAALSRIYSPFGGPKIGAWQDDPFGLFAGWLQARAAETPVRPRDGRLYVGAGRREYVVLPMTLGVSSFSLEAGEAVTPLLARARAAAGRAAPGVEVVAAGVVLHAAAAAEQARREMSVIGIGSTVGIVLLTWLAFRSLQPIAWIMLSIGVGCLGALSVSWLVFGRVHLLTLVFGASLIGVAEDYGIYFLCSGFADDDRPADARRTLRPMLPALALALATSALGYLALALTPFPGLRQMAVFSAVGLVFAWLTVVFWFPALARARTFKSGRAAERYAALWARWPSLRLDRRTLLAAALFVALAGFGLSRLTARDDIRSLQNPPKELLDDQIKLGKLLDAPSPAQFYLVRAATPEGVLEREEALKQRLEPLIEKHVIGGYQALSNWAPSPRAQAARRALIEEKLLGADGALVALAARIGEDRRWVAATRERLLAAAAPVALDDFLKSPASEPWRHLWIGPVDGGYASVVLLRGVGAAVLPGLQTLSRGLVGVEWVDKVGEISSVLGRYREYMAWVVLVSYLAVYALLYPRYRGAAWRVLAPSALASLAALALLGLAGQGLQLFHVLALMLLLGIGVDYGIFLHEHPSRRDRVGWLAVGLSALSTLLSFGLLALSRTPALRAFGLTLLIGIAAVWAIAPCFGYGENESRGQI